jgi:hypothetical protein
MGPLELGERSINNPAMNPPIAALSCELRIAHIRVKISRSEKPPPGNRN